jgi:hypothetical protein
MIKFANHIQHFKSRFNPLLWRGPGEVFLLFFCAFFLFAPVSAANGLWHDKERELRYTPDGDDFVIVNGKAKFNRALYGTHTAFRVETGDVPEFGLYLPGMGGNLHFGLMVEGQTK